MESLKGKVVVITGGNDGIGKQIAFKLSEIGAKLALIARNEEKLKTIQDEIGSDTANIYPCDIRDSQQRKSALAKILEDYEEVDVLINNAGVIHELIPLEELKEEVVEEVLQTNLIGLIQLTRLFLPALKKRSESAIINIASVSGTIARKGQSVYAASKWGVRGFSNVLKTDLEGTSVRVACVCQSGTNTDLFVKANDMTRPLEQYTDPADLADIIVFMLSQPDKCWIHEVRVAH